MGLVATKDRDSKRRTFTLENLNIEPILKKTQDAQTGQTTQLHSMARHSSTAPRKKRL